MGVLDGSIAVILTVLQTLRRLPLLFKLYAVSPSHRVLLLLLSTMSGPPQLIRNGTETIGGVVCAVTIHEPVVCSITTNCTTRSTNSRGKNLPWDCNDIGVVEPYRRRVGLNDSLNCFIVIAVECMGCEIL